MSKDIVNLKKGGIVIYDSESIKYLPANINEYTSLAMPLRKIASDMGAALLRDTVVLGAVCLLLKANQVVMREVISEEFKSKNEKIKNLNIKAIEAGYEYAEKHYKKIQKPILAKLNKIEQKMIITGNEAAAFGALAGGMQFASIYPMTPITNIVHVLAKLQTDYGFIYRQPEDEISAINMAIGAAFAGARAMTATSGGGYSLMTEAIGLSGMTETPIVVIEGMRTGPSTGLPTWTEQADLRFVLHGHQGDLPKIVVAPGDVNETYETVRQAFNLAEKYQVPVIVLLDKQICESHESVSVFDPNCVFERGKFTTKSIADYHRYAMSSDGVSLRAPAGTVNHVIGNSDEHDDKGYSSDDAMIRDLMMKKRMKKIETCEAEDMQAPKIYGPRNADLTLVCWGSTKGAALEAIAHFDNVNVVHTSWMNPFPKEALKKILAKSKKLVNVEGNYAAQFGGLLAEQTGIRITDNILKFDGRPFFTEELVAEISKRI